jgi:hypothetical protein
MSKSKISNNPVLNYSINTSSDPIAISIVNNFKIVYNNYVAFVSVDDNSKDTSILDNAATQIQINFDKITDIMMPCTSDPTSYLIKCTSNDACKWSSDVEKIALDFIILISGMTTSKIKEEYQFVSFFMIRKFYDAITNNEGNFEPAVVKSGSSTLTPSGSSRKVYFLCGNIQYGARLTDPVLEARFNAHRARMQVQLENKNQREYDRSIITFLLYILLPVVVFILLILTYVKHSKSDAAHKKVDDFPIKTGGALYDTINFIGTIGKKIFRV